MQDSETIKTNTSRVSTLVESSTKQFLEGKVIEMMEQNSVEISQHRQRDNILIKMKDDAPFKVVDQISEHEESEEESHLDELAVKLDSMQLSLGHSQSEQ